jgi:carbon monoxide dehydrogenase subunit G
VKLRGEALLHGSPEEVWRRLLDPVLIARCIPGCQRLEEVSPGHFETLVSGGVGILHGRFHGDVRISDPDPPRSYRMSLSGDSTVGHVRGSALLRLRPEGACTRVSYEGEAQIKGLLSLFGGRKLEGVAHEVVGRFFQRLMSEAEG